VPGPYDWAMRWMRWALIVSALGLPIALPANAFALVLAPPGHAGANQYFEVIPTSAGNAAPPGSVSGSGSAQGGPQALAPFGKGRSGDTKLAKLGKDGQAAAALAASTAPSVPGATGRAGTSSLNGATSQGGSASGGVADALTGSDAGGLGLLLPLLLATALVAALGIAAARLRRRPASPG
jgi:hypothetical protein